MLSITIGRMTMEVIVLCPHKLGQMVDTYEVMIKINHLCLVTRVSQTQRSIESHCRFL